MNRRLIIIAVSVTLLAGAVLLLSTSEEQPQTASNDQQMQSSGQTGQSDESAEDTEEQIEESTAGQKPAGPVARVAERPEVFTSFGHVETNPVKNGQQVSTTCTTEPNTDCYITLTSGLDMITFDSKTSNSDGVAIWNWTGGDEVTGGTWKVTSTAGDKTSLSETVYVQ